MILRCPECGEHIRFYIVREYTDGRGRRWEVYQCEKCGHRVKYAVT